MSRCEITQEARAILDKIEPVLGQSPTDSQVAAWLSGVLRVVENFSSDALDVVTSTAGGELLSGGGSGPTLFTGEDAGEPVIRIMSRIPVSEPFVTFLLDVRWSSGRLQPRLVCRTDDPDGMHA